MDKGLKAELVRPGVYRCTWGYIWDLKVYGCEGYDVEEIDDDIDCHAEALVTVGHWPCGLDAFRSPIRLRRAFEYWRSELVAHDSLALNHAAHDGIVHVGRHFS